MLNYNWINIYDVDPVVSQRWIFAVFHQSFQSITAHLMFFSRSHIKIPPKFNTPECEGFKQFFQIDTVTALCVVNLVLNHGYTYCTDNNNDNEGVSEKILATGYVFKCP